MYNFLKSRDKTSKLISRLLKSVHLQSIIEQDLLFLYKNDPSAKSINQVKCYTSAFAVAAYRAAHEQDDETAREIAEYAKSITGIDIHPCAQIGVPFAIDHGVGTVIGETCVIGKNCLLYHGVTLGAKHLKERDQAGTDRHPKLGDGVIIYSNTTILGNIKIPSNTIVGANKLLKSQSDIDKLTRCPK
jgi:serine O-acetyltransferase